MDTGVLWTPDTRDYVSAKLHGLSFCLRSHISASPYMARLSARVVCPRHSPKSQLVSDADP